MTAIFRIVGIFLMLLTAFILSIILAVIEGPDFTAGLAMAWVWLIIIMIAVGAFYLLLSVIRALSGRR